MMTPFRGLRDILRELASQPEDLEVLPAVGGAVQDLDRPDFEEREDQALGGGERVFDTVFERASAGDRPPLYRAVPPLSREENHLFRYFLDGSFRSYFLGTLMEHERETPVHFAQVGGCVLHRQDDGSVRREALEVHYLLMVGKLRVSQRLWQQLEQMTAAQGIQLVDLTEEDIITRVLSDFDLRNKAAGKVRSQMHKLEGEMIGAALLRLSPESWLIVDGSLLFHPAKTYIGSGGEIKPVIGVAKNFRKDPQFVYGRGARAERRSIFRLLSELEVEHRTAAFAIDSGRAVFWYVRLRQQKQLDYPLMGVVKVELGNPTGAAVPSDLLDTVSRALVAERSVTPHGQDHRWHAHLYPIFLAERAVKEGLLGQDVVQQYLKWR